MHTLEDLYQKQQALEARLAAIEQRMATDGMAETVDGMVLIPAGDFQMGDSFGEGGPAERPAHTVTVSAFYMDRYEVTKAQWDEVYNWAVTHGYGFDNAGSGKEPSHPVHSVNWFDVVKWANARSEKDNLPTVYRYFTGTGHDPYRTGQQTNLVVFSGGYRLPTEAEWEKAARGGVGGGRFPWADVNVIHQILANYFGAPATYSYDTSVATGYHPAFNDGIAPYTSPVGSFPPNGYGLYDMAGNLQEWCWDWYSDAYYASSAETDPLGPESGLFRVFRGGSWYRQAFESRVAYRDFDSLSAPRNYVGFRCVRRP